MRRVRPGGNPAVRHFIAQLPIRCRVFGFVARWCVTVASNQSAAVPGPPSLIHVRCSPIMKVCPPRRRAAYPEATRATATRILRDVKLRAASRQFDEQNPDHLQAARERAETDSRQGRVFRTDRGRGPGLFQVEDRPVPRRAKDPRQTRRPPVTTVLWGRQDACPRLCNNSRRPFHLLRAPIMPAACNRQAESLYFPS